MCDYMDISCIAKMQEQHKAAFKALVEEYSPKLSSRIVKDGAVYTLHDFEHHCLGIYKLISQVLFDEAIVYSSAGLDSRELFILNCAVLFHDIGMTMSLDAKRENHSLKSAEYIQTEYDNARSSLKTKSTLIPLEIKALKEIVKAHSDVKDDSVKKSENGLLAPNLHKAYQTKSGKQIRTKFLAGVLRLADEFDISSERLGTGELETELERLQTKIEKDKRNPDANKGEIEKFTGYVKSLSYWKRLHYISNVRRNQSSDDTIDIIIDDEYVERCINAGNTYEAIARELSLLYAQLDERLKECIQLAFDESILKKFVSVCKLNFVTENERLNKELQKTIEVRSIYDKKENDRCDGEVQIDFVQIQKPQVINQKLEESIYNEIERRNLIKFGHFLLTDKYCARDWIDTQEVVETKKLLNLLVDAIVKHIESKRYQGFTIIGIDLVGSLLASRIAFSLQVPLSYVVSEKNIKFSGSQEKGISGEIDKIILITDAIVTFETVTKIIERHSWDNKIDAIYTIFYRSSEQFDGNVSYLDKTYSINNKFKAELFEKKNCVYNKDKCIALNKRMANNFQEKGDDYEDSEVEF